MKILVVDGNSIVNRAFYGVKLLSNSKGVYTNAIHGFITILMRTEEKTQADAIAIAFDLKAPTFRHKMYDDYKAGRKGMPEELKQQIPILKDLLKELGYVIVSKEGYEADDILGTLSSHCGSENFSFLLTGDKDSFQLINENVTVLWPHSGAKGTETKEYTVATIKDEFGVTPNQMIDIKALQGDTSDNIPGVPGIGPKTAQSLISTYGSIENIYENIEEIPIREKMREKLKENKESAFFSYKLGTIDTNVPIDTNIESYIKGKPTEKAKELLKELEFKQLLNKIF